MPITVVIRGDKEALKTLGLYKEGADALADTRVLIGTSVEYAIYQEEGTRSLSGVHYLKNALDEVAPGVGAAVQAALPKGRAAVVSTLHTQGLKVQSGGQQRSPVKTGNLRRSIHTVVNGRI